MTKQQKWTKRLPTRAGYYYLRTPTAVKASPAIVQLVLVDAFRSMSVNDDPSVVKLGVGDGGGEEPVWLEQLRARGCSWLRVPTPAELTEGAR